MTTPDVPHRFELELEVPGTPEQVWRAIASEDGISAWMMPTDLDPREGGSVTFKMGPDAESVGRVTAFEPPNRVAYEEDWATLAGHPDADVTPLVTEFLVEARSGGTCSVRIVTSAFGTGADWENEFWEEMDLGWAPMLDNLRLYLTSFPDQKATTLWVDATFSGPPDDGITELRRVLGVGSVGDTVAINGAIGRLEREIDRHILLRIESPVPGFLSFFTYDTGEESKVQLLGYLFSQDAPAYLEREEASWHQWLDGVAAGIGAARSA